MLNKILHLSTNKWFWIAFFALGISFEVIALVYQYALNYMPCVLCIHTRIWALAMILVSILGMILYKSKKGVLFAQFLMTIVTAGMFERAYQLLGTERGFLMGGCSMDSGLPAWFALDEWLPLMFKVWEPCGYTPELLFGVTMAEALIVLSFVLLIVNLLLTVTLAARQFIKNG